MNITEHWPVCVKDNNLEDSYNMTLALQNTVNVTIVCKLS